ncbi:MAG TPA: phosphate acyltransferase PlsX [Bacteroidales bacterium]|nr:phosphate acyltransferase PlsX [Bacteroidales bacterium]
MRIGLDVMGGDYAPQQTVAGAVNACHQFNPSNRIVLIGPSQLIEDELANLHCDCRLFDIVDASENIEMHDNPVKAFELKPDSSIVKGFKMLASGEIDGFASVGNTGAMMVGAMQVIKPARGVIRPCISSVYPNVQGGNSLFLDVGLNADSKPEMLLQFAQIGSVFSELVFRCNHPKVGLLNIGSEPGKGNLLSKSAYELLSNNKQINFIGNVEANQLFDAAIVDVIVTDGFVGNILLKQAEGFYELMKKRNISDSYFDKYNFELYGGTPVLGINKSVVIGHGRSSAKAIESMLLQTERIVEVNLCEEIIKFMSHDKNQSFN